MLRIFILTKNNAKKLLTNCKKKKKIHKIVGDSFFLSYEMNSLNFLNTYEIS